MSRALWYLFFIALLALGGAGYYWLGSGKEQIRNATTSVAAKGEIEKTAGFSDEPAMTLGAGRGWRGEAAVPADPTGQPYITA